jgi:hypothetical protein
MAEFWTPADWPPYSLDLNPLDFSVWSVLHTGEGPGYAPHQFGGPTPVHHQAVDPDAAGLHPPDLPLFPPPPEGRRGEKWQLY